MARAGTSDMQHLNGHKLCVIDTETTGLEAGYHEIIQICVLPVGASFEIDTSIEPFVAMIKPEYPNRWSKEAAAKNGLKGVVEKHGLDRDLVYDMFVKWFFKLNLAACGEKPYTKQIVPMAKNWAFDKGFLNAWMGKDDDGDPNIDYFIHRYARELQAFALGMQDLAYMNANEVYPFTRFSLGALCKRLNVVNPNAHDALGDCVATLECYKRLLSLRLPAGQVDLNISHPSWNAMVDELPSLRKMDEEPDE